MVRDLTAMGGVVVLTALALKKTAVCMTVNNDRKAQPASDRLTAD